jgi:hypothetical protein
LRNISTPVIVVVVVFSDDELIADFGQTDSECLQ